jgi:hypothetical protein
MAGVRCPKCERVIRFHARGEKKIAMQCTSKRCGTLFTAQLMGPKWPQEPKKRRRKDATNS